MMKITLGLAVAILLSGCATERFGRLTPLGQFEGQHLSCDQIAIEIAKCDEFLSSTTAQSKEFTSTDVMAFLGDFGIGNQMEYQSAIKSGQTRRRALIKLQSEKQCVVVSPTMADSVLR